MSSNVAESAGQNYEPHHHVNMLYLPHLVKNGDPRACARIFLFFMHQHGMKELFTRSANNVNPARTSAFWQCPMNCSNMRKLSSNWFVPVLLKCYTRANTNKAMKSVSQDRQYQQAKSTICLQMSSNPRLSTRNCTTQVYTLSRHTIWLETAVLERTPVYAYMHLHGGEERFTRSTLSSNRQSNTKLKIRAASYEDAAPVFI